MRVAPVGLYFANTHADLGVKAAFEMGVMSAALTHGHLTGQLASGVFAAVIQRLVEGRRLIPAIDEAERALMHRPRHGETLQALRKARALAADGQPSPEAIESLGAGWVAEEALAISVYCALVASSFEHGVRLAINHSGDSDSTGSMTGQLLGALQGEQAIPPRWAGQVELGWLARELADDLHDRHD